MKVIRRTLHFSAGGALGLGLIAALSLASLGAGRPTADQAIKQVTRSAIEDPFDAGTLKGIDWSKGRASEVAVAAIHVGLQKRLASHMTGDAMTQWSNALHEAVDREAD